jgi:hypothetical protein
MLLPSSRNGLIVLTLALVACGAEISEPTNDVAGVTTQALTSPSSSTRTGFNATGFSVARQSNGTLRVFGHRVPGGTTTGEIASTYQTVPDAGWLGSWVSTFPVGNMAKAKRTPYSALRTDGNLEVAWINTSGAWCRGVQPIGSGTLSFAACVGGGFDSVSRPVAQPNGRLLEAVRGSSTSDAPILHRQKAISGQEPDNWEQMGTIGVSGSPVAPVILAVDGGGYVHYFQKAMAAPLFAYHGYQTSLNGTSWSFPSGIAMTNSQPTGAALGAEDWLAVGKNADGRLELFAAGSDGNIWHSWQTSTVQPTAPFSAWTQMPALGTMRSPAVAINQNGRLEVFAVLTSYNMVVSRTQVVANGGWGPWEYRMDSSAGPLDVGTNVPSLRLELFSREPWTNEVQHRWQVAPNTW